MAMLYLDNSATTMSTPPVMEAVNQGMARGWMNPSALYAPAMGVQKEMEAARQVLQRAMAADGYRIVFTSGGTESNTLRCWGLRNQPGRRAWC